MFAGSIHATFGQGAYYHSAILLPHDDIIDAVRMCKIMAERIISGWETVHKIKAVHTSIHVSDVSFQIIDTEKPQVYHEIIQRYPPKNAQELTPIEDTRSLDAYHSGHNQK